MSAANRDASKANFDDMRAWAKTLTNDQLDYAFEELRARGCALACYSDADLFELFDLRESKEEEIKTWFVENKDAVEEATCEAARDFMKREMHEIDAHESDEADDA